MTECKDIRQPMPIICKHGDALWPWKALMDPWTKEYLCRRCTPLGGHGVWLKQMHDTLKANLVIE